MEDKLLKRIKNLLSLASSNNEHEAASAAAEAQRLMLEHGIETAQLSTADAPKAADRQSVDTGSMNVWVGVLAHHVAKATFCTVYRETGAGAGKSTNRLSICGFPGDIAACSLLLAWLTAEVNKFCEKEWLTQKASGVSANAWKKSFRLGACATIGQRLSADRETAKRELQAASGTTGTALVHLFTYEKQSEQAVSTFLASSGVHLKKGNKTSVKDVDAYSRGREAGKQINLNAPKRALTG